jgi:MOSC domain-containing protein YiiM
MSGGGGGRLSAIWLKRFKRGPMDPRETATLVPGRGLAGNANQGGRRQVILISEEGWTEAVDALGDRVDPATRRANLMVSGVKLEATRGKVLRVGLCRLRIWSECAPCKQMDEARPGLRSALRPHWRGGACAEVLEGGEIRVGDAIAWEEPPAS